jgi:IS1 family transposase
MNRLSTENRARVIAALVEGCSIRATARMTGVSKPTILKLLLDLGRACDAYQREHLVGLTCQRVQCDEIWSFVAMKAKTVPEDRRGENGIGDVWTWVALDAETKLVVSWLVGQRDLLYATAFIGDLASRLTHRIQLTTDGHSVYLDAVEAGFGDEIDCAMLQKLYGTLPEAQARYSPAVCIGTRVETIQGAPDPAHISTSYVERQNLTMRMSMRRLTRLTNAFSKKIEYHEAAIALHFMHYNFCRIHRALRVTPAMQAGITDHLWSLGDLIGLLK